MDKLTPEETLKAVETFDEGTGDAEMDRVLAMTPEERDAELRAAGFDLAAVDAESDRLHAELVGEPGREVADAQVQPAREVVGRRRAPSRRWAVGAWAAAAAIALPALSLVAFHYLQPKEPVVIRPEPPPPDPTANLRRAAADLRQDATEGCAKELWGLCGDRLDEAQKLDPAGESTPDVQQMRRAIKANSSSDSVRQEKGVAPGQRSRAH
jgi:hypothetical protein